MLDFRSSAGEVIEAMAGNEEAIGCLYLEYAARFPAQKGFWTELAVEKATHAQWLRGLRARVKEGTLSINKDRFKLQPVRAFSRYLERETANATGPGLSPINALSVALYIEESIIEQRYFEVAAADDPVMKRILADLSASTRTHLERVRREWAAQRL